jgi:hypothetical protein
MSLLTEHRANLDNLTTLAIADTVTAVNLLQDRPVPELAFQLRETLPAIAQTYSDVAQTLAVDYYDASRVEARNLTSRYEAERIDYDTNTPVQNNIGYSIARITEGTDFATVTGILAGGMMTTVLGAERENIGFNVVTDPDGTKYARVPSGDACAFCLTMAAVAVESRSDYFDGYHNFCRCTIEPIFTGQTGTELPIYKQVREAYSLADQELERQRAEVGFNSMKRREAAAKYPDLILNTQNHLRLIRQITGWS